MKKGIKFLIVIALVFSMVGTAIYFYLNKNKETFVIENFSDVYKTNHNGDYNNPLKVCYKKGKKCIEIEPTVEGNVDNTVMGEYKVKYTYTYNDQEKVIEQTVVVTDLIGPEITVDDESKLEVCPNGKIVNKELVKIKDNLDGEIKDYETSLDNNRLTIKATDSYGNISSKELDVNPLDDKKPTITLNGKKNISLTPNSKYEEQGASVTDNCDDSFNVDISGTVDTKTKGEYIITYTATDSANNTESVTRKVTIKDKVAGEKVVYLTFDDGPGSYTAQLLDVLKKYDVKVTFFVTGKGSDDLIKRAYDEGHQIGLHSYTHDYKEIYASQDAYFKDLYRIRDRVKRITGYESNIIRFPGGSSNTVSKISMRALTKEVINRGFYYFDWNVSSGDAGGTTTADGVYNNVTNALKSGYSVVLQHDIKKYSVEAVERIIQYGIANGYTFERLEEDSYGARHL